MGSQRVGQDWATELNWWDNIKCANLCTAGIPEGEGRERGLKMYLKKYNWKFPKPKRENWYPDTRNLEGLKQNEPNRPTPRQNKNVKS